MLSASITHERFQAVRWRYSQIVEIATMMQYVEFSYRLFLDAAEALDENAHP